MSDLSTGPHVRSTGTGVDAGDLTMTRPDLVLTTLDCTPQENVRRVLTELVKRGFLLEEDGVRDLGGSGDA